MVGQTLLGLEIPGVQFEVAVHVATLISVLVVYRSRLIDLMYGTLRRDRDALRYVGLLALASLPAGIVGVFFLDPIQGAVREPVRYGHRSFGDRSDLVEHAAGARAARLEITDLGRGTADRLRAGVGAGARHLPLGDDGGGGAMARRDR